MRNRFNSSYNKPSKLALTSKRKVMAEFRNYKEDIKVSDRCRSHFILDYCFIDDRHGRQINGFKAANVAYSRS